MTHFILLRVLSGRKNYGTLTNMGQAAAWTMSDGRTALSFDGVNDLVDCGVVDAFSGRSKFSFTQPQKANRMTPERYREAAESGSLTSSEVIEGWHFCRDFDGLLVGPEMDGAWELCTCVRGKAALAGDAVRHWNIPPVQPNGPGTYWVRFKARNGEVLASLAYWDDSTAEWCTLQSASEYREEDYTFDRIGEVTGWMEINPPSVEDQQ